MPEDKLTHDERLRLECLAQANAYGTPRGHSPSEVVGIASTFEDYVSGQPGPAQP